MTKTTISEEDLVLAESLRYKHPDNAVKRRMTVLYFKGLSRSHLEIEELAGASSATVSKVLKLYAKGGLPPVADVKHRSPQSELELHRDAVLCRLKLAPPSTSKEARSEIKRLTGLDRGLTQLRVFMQSMVLNLVKWLQFPPKQIQKCRKILKKVLEPRLVEAEAGERQVYFLDAAHFILGVYLSTVWSTERLFIKSSPGRNRFNVLAALSPVTFNMTEISNTTTINAWSIADLF